MKKNILLIAAALFLFLGNQSVTAQAKMKKEVQSSSAEKTDVIAKEKTTSLIRSLSLTKDQQDQVYKLFRNVEGKMNSSSSVTDTKEQEAIQAKMDKYVMGSMKQILKEEQFKKYLEMAKDL
ncbi:hypothetical protein [Psychroserpens sp.]